MRSNKHILLPALAIALIALAACTHNHQYTLQGHIPDSAFDGDMAYLTDITGRTVIDSAAIQDRTFTFQGVADTTGIATVVAPGHMVSYTGTVVLEPGHIYMNLVDDSLRGTPLNDTLATYLYSPEARAHMQALTHITQQIQNSTDETTQMSLLKTYDSIQEQTTTYLQNSRKQLYARHADNILGAFALYNMATDGEYPFPLFDSLMSNAAPVVARFAPNQALLKRLRAVENTSQGHPYTNIIGLAATAQGNGDTLSLQQLIQGKTALIDFWASWCGPCRQEIINNLIPIYQHYQSENFIVVGIDISDTEEEVAKAIRNLNIPYPVIFADKEAAQNYGIYGIPQIILIDTEGTIVARDLRGAAIEQAVTAALNK